MKKIVLITLWAVLLSCNNDDNEAQALPTSFSGQVIYQDTGNPMEGGTISIAGTEIRFPSDNSVVREEQLLGADGRFEITFEANVDVDRFSLSIFDVPQDPPARTYNGIICKGVPDCGGISPGQDYIDVVIELLPLEP